MILLKIKLGGHCKEYQRYEPGYSETATCYENIIYFDYYLFGIVLIYRTIIFKEEVPSYAFIQTATLGFTDWLSTRPLLINATRNFRRLTIKTIKI